jgi:putative redox protein
MSFVQASLGRNFSDCAHAGVWNNWAGGIGMTERQHTVATWRERMTFDATTTTGHHVVMDGSHESDDQGPSPMELLLTALSGCTGTTVLGILQKKREPVEGLEVRVEGRRAEQHPRVYVEIDVLYRVYGAVSPQSVERAIQLSEEKYCGVSTMLAETAIIRHRHEIIAGVGASASAEAPNPAQNSAGA